jgi:HNH endonuclease
VPGLQLICTGGYQKILFGHNGEIRYLGGKERCFTTRQRKAIAARDGGCVICGAPVNHTEVHHVHPWRTGGPTNIDNGVLLCWYHHHGIDTSGWEIRMIRGKPQIKAPTWYDPTATWRPAHSHRANQPTPPSRV